MAALRAALPAEAEPLAGIHAADLDDSVPGLLLSYLRTMQSEGIGPRWDGEPSRVHALPHPSAAAYMGEAVDKIWEDAAAGRLLVCDSRLAELAGVRESSLARVPKMNPDRTVSEEGRLITDMKKTNTKGSKFRHPPALQPRHAEVAREILWWKARHPGVEVLLAKRDISSAFKLLNLSPACSLIMAISIPGSSVGLDFDISVIYRVANFGWLGAPGEWMAWAWALKMWYEARGPSDPEAHDDVAFHIFILMDDPVLVEPNIGIRPWLAAGALEEGIRKIFGPKAVNEKKLKAEGRFVTCLVIWGLVE